MIILIIVYQKKRRMKKKELKKISIENIKSFLENNLLKEDLEYIFFKK